MIDIEDSKTLSDIGDLLAQCSRIPIVCYPFRYLKITHKSRMNVLDVDRRTAMHRHCMGRLPIPGEDLSEATDQSLFRHRVIVLLAHGSRTKHSSMSMKW